jgi:hypothetical protein
MLPTLLLTATLLGASASASTIIWLHPHRGALIKLDTPNYPSWVYSSVQKTFKTTPEPTAVLLNITLSADNKTLFLNDKAILPLENWNIPPLISAYQVPAQIDKDEMGYLVQNNLLLTGANRLLALDYDRLVDADPTPGPPYHDHRPTLRFRVMGLGADTQDHMLTTHEQSVVHVSLEDQNHGRSNDEKRSYRITDMQVKSVEESYDETHLGPQMDVEEEGACTAWSWTCPDKGMDDPQNPYHRFIWRRKFDQYGRIGSGRHTAFSKISAFKKDMGIPEESGSGILILGALLGAVLAVVAGVVMFRNTSSKAEEETEKKDKKSNGEDGVDDDDDEAWLQDQAEQVGEVEVTVDEVAQMMDLISDDEDEKKSS